MPGAHVSGGYPDKTKKPMTSQCFGLQRGRDQIRDYIAEPIEVVRTKPKIGDESRKADGQSLQPEDKLQECLENNGIKKVAQHVGRQDLKFHIRRYEDDKYLFEVNLPIHATVRQLHAFIVEELFPPDTNPEPVKLFFQKVHVRISDQQIGNMGLDHNSMLHVARTRRRLLLLSSGSDGTVRLWSCRSFRCIQTFLHPACVNHAALNNDTSMVLTSCLDGILRIWSADKGNLKYSFSGHNGQTNWFSIDYENTKVATCSEDCTVRLYSLAKEKCVGVLTGHQGAVNCVEFSPNGLMLATASRDRNACVWKMDRKGGASCHAPIVGHQGEVRTIAWSHDSKMLVTSSSDKTVRIWDARGGQCSQVLGGHDAFLFQAEFTCNDGKVYTASPNGTIRLWAVGSKGSNNCVRVMKMGCQIIGAFVVGHNDKMYAICPEEGGRGPGFLIKVHSPDDDEPPMTFQGHCGRVTCGVLNTAG
jgi:WD40 repeat protein